MSLISKLSAARQRRRASSAFDSSFRLWWRQVERRVKFALSSPLGVLLRPHRATKPFKLDEVSSILIFRYDALGDAILTTPVWRSIKKYAPHIRIGVVGSSRNRQLLIADPDIDDVYTLSKAFTAKGFREIVRARKIKWDIVLNLFFHDKTRAAIYAKLIAPKAVSSTIVHNNQDKYRKLYSVIGDRESGKPMVLQNLQVLTQVINISLTPADHRPSLFVDEQVDLEFSGKLTRLLSGKRDYVLINTDASQSFREWGLKNNLALSLKILQSNSARHVFWTCAPERKQFVKDFLASHDTGRIVLLDTPTVQHLAAAVKHSIAVVSPDTSVIHFASAFQKPVVGFYLDQTEFLPFETPSRVLYPPDGRTASLTSVDRACDALIELIG